MYDLKERLKELLRTDIRSRNNFVTYWKYIETLIVGIIDQKMFIFSQVVKILVQEYYNVEKELIFYEDLS